MAINVAINLPRYSVRIQHAGGRVEVVGSTIDREQSLRWAVEHHHETGKRVWVLDIHTRKIIREIAPRPVAGRGRGQRQTTHAIAGGTA